jgi:hypothetical protein
MRSRLKYSSTLAAAAIALACGAPGAFATNAGSFTGTVTYNAQTVALATPAFSAVVPSGNLLYQSSATGMGGPAAATSFTIVWTTTGTGTAFLGALSGAAPPAGNVQFTGGTGANCNAATATVASGTGNTITVVGTVAAAGGTGAFCRVTLVSAGAAPTPPGLPVSVTGLTNLGPTAAATTNAAFDNPTAIFGTQSATQNSTTLGLGNLNDVITVQQTADTGTAANIDVNPGLSASLSSANTWNAINVTGAPAFVDLSGAPGTPQLAPGLGFQRVANGVLSSTTAASLGTITITQNNGLLDARSATQCCNIPAGAGTVNNANTPLPLTFTVSILGDFQTITNAYLRPGNNSPGNTVTPAVNGATPNVEQNPNVNAFNSVCTPTGGSGSDIASTAGGPTVTGPNFTNLTFVIPPKTTSVNGNINVNDLTYAVCVVTNGTNLIADTTGNAPGVSGAGGPVLAGTSTTIRASVPTLVADLATNITNAKGLDIVYAGTKVVFPNVFNASTGRPSSFRLVNTGLGVFPVYAILQKDGSAPITIPGSFAAMTPFSAFYVIADAIAFQGGQTLALNNTITLLTPAPPGALVMTHFLNDPNGDIVLVPAGL